MIKANDWIPAGVYPILEIRATEVAPTHEEKVKCSFIYAKLNNTTALNALRLTPHPFPLPLKGRGER
jgi:hypothetical protein